MPVTRKRLIFQELVEGVHYRTPWTNFLSVSPQSDQRAFEVTAMCAEDLTFHNLSDILTREGEAHSSSAANLVSALRKFTESLGMNMSDVIGPTFRGAFYVCLAEHLDGLRTAGRPKEYRANRKALLKKCRHRVMQLDVQAAMENHTETPLSAALRSLEERTDNFWRRLRSIGVGERRIRAYLRGGIPGRGAVDALTKLEKYFDMTPGELVGRLPTNVKRPLWTRLGRRTQESLLSVKTTEYRRQISAARKDQYRLKVDEISNEFREQWGRYVAYKTDPWAVAKTATGRPRRLSCWRCRAIPSRKASRWDWVSQSTGQWCPTAGHYFNMTSDFLGYLKRTRSDGGGGVPLSEALTLAWYTDASRVKEFLAWRKERAGGVINGAVWKTLVHAAALCQPDRGFLWLNFDIGQKFGYETEAEWRRHCKESYVTYRQLMKIFAPDRAMSRDPFEPIKEIIALENPMQAVFDAIRKMDYDRPPPGGEAELLWWRNRILLSLSASNPLRARNLKELTFREDNTGSLRRDPDGHYRIVIKSKFLKNHTGAGAKEYNVRVQKSLTPYLDQYLKKYLPRLARGMTDRVFVKTTQPEEEWTCLNYTFGRITRRYFKNSPGFGPHCMRHIVATSLVKRHGSFAAAATVLHDYEATVRMHYGYLVGDDGARWVEDIWADSR